jgi:hypothetical protein
MKISERIPEDKLYNIELNSNELKLLGIIVGQFSEADLKKDIESQSYFVKVFPNVT